MASRCPMDLNYYGSSAGTFLEYERLGVLDISKVTFQGYEVVTSEGELHYHSHDCADVKKDYLRNLPVTEISLKDILSPGVRYGRCCSEVQSGSIFWIWSFGYDDFFVDPYHTDFDNLNLARQSQELRDMRESRDSISEDYPEVFKTLMNALEELIKEREKIFKDTLFSEENTKFLFEGCIEKLSNKLIKPLQSSDPLCQPLTQLLQESKNKLAEGFRASDTYVTFASEGYLSRGQFAEGSFPDLCLVRWAGEDAKIASLPLVVFEWVFEDKEVKANNLVFSQGRPSDNIIETASRLYGPTSSAYSSFKTAYQAALAIEEV